MFMSSLNSFGQFLARGCFDPPIPYNSWTSKTSAFWLAISPLTTSNTESKALSLDSQGFGEATVVVAAWFGFFPKLTHVLQTNTDHSEQEFRVLPERKQSCLELWDCTSQTVTWDQRPRLSNGIFGGLRQGLDWAFQILLLGMSLPQRKVIPSLTHGDYFYVMESPSNED